VCVFQIIVKVAASGTQAYFGGPQNSAKQTVNTAERLQFMNTNIQSGKVVTSVMRLLGKS
jgi:hypothetical protein